MATTALGIMQDSSGAGLDPLTHRRIISAMWGNAGVVSGLEVTGGTGLSYSVAPGVAVCSRAESDGKVELYFEGGSAGPVSAGDPSNPRIDCVWVKANDAQQGDADNRVHVGVTQGAASPSPSAPELPAGATLLASMRMPAGAQSTASATPASNTAYAIPYGASLGLLAEAVDARDYVKDNDNSYSQAANVQFTVPTDRLVELECRICVGACKPDGSLGGDWLQYSVGSFYVKCSASDDPNKNVDGGSMQVTCFRSNTIYELRPIVKVPAGTHSAYLSFRFSPEGNPAHVVYDPDAYKFPGATMRVWDRGVAL